MVMDTHVAVVSCLFLLKPESANAISFPNSR
jgi:hypothetical protein